MKLYKLTPGTNAIIASICTDSLMLCRLMEMGFVEGAEIQLIRSAPLGGSYQIRIGDYEMAVCKKAADLIEVNIQSVNDISSCVIKSNCELCGSKDCKIHCEFDRT